MVEKKVMARCESCNTVWEITDENYGTTPCDCPDDATVVLVLEEAVE